MEAVATRPSFAEALHGVAPIAQAKRPWTPADSVAVRYVVSNQSGPGWLGPSERNAIQWSRDRKYFFFVLRHGNVACDCNVYELNLFAAEDVLRRLSSEIESSEYVAPKAVVTFRSATNEAAISEAKWDEHGSSVLFLGVEKTGRRQIFRLNAETGALARLSDGSKDISAFQVRGGSYVYRSWVDPTPRRKLDSYPVSVVEDFDLAVAFGFPEALRYGVFGAYQTGEEHMIVPPSYAPWPFFPDAWISPDGTKAVLPVFAEDVGIPAPWRAYQGIRSANPQRQYAQFMIVDLRTGQKRALLDAPLGTATMAGTYGRSVDEIGKGPVPRLKPNVLWSPDSEYVILINTALPLSEGEEEREYMAYVVSVDLASGHWQIIERLQSPDGARRVSRVAWKEPGEELLIEYERPDGVPERSRVFSRQKGVWNDRVAFGNSGRHTEKSGFGYGLLPFSVCVQQSANDPPMVVASSGDHQLNLTRPDPALMTIERAPVKTIHWREPGGRSASGGLLLPPGARRGVPLPLVIQAYYFDRGLFRPDGPFPTAYAGQALAAQGIAVLNLSIPTVEEGARTAREGPVFVERIDAAVRYLADEGLVDPTRVGLIGFSAAGYLTYFAITHPGRTRLAAAIDADGWQGSYFEYVVAAVAGPGIAAHLPHYEVMAGGASFWKNKLSWLENVPGFNVEQVRTPTMLTVTGRMNRALYAEFLAAFRLNGLPLEWLHFPDALHQLQRPRERLAAMEATVDWMNFWLRRVEHPGAEKRQQYARWRGMRERWNEIFSAEAEQR